MEWIFLALTILGLSLFEIISSVDNAIINAEVLSTMSKKARRWFLIWGIIIAVFLVRGILPFVIVWASNPSLKVTQVFSSTLSSDPLVVETIMHSAPILLVGGGTFLIFLFVHWLFMEPKHYGLPHEEFIYRNGLWFYAIVSILLATIVWFSLKVHPMMAFSAVIGSTAFFITHGFKENAEKMEEKMIEQKKGLSDWSKIMYLEVIDATFSIDGVLGAFAFTFAIPLILIGNGIGAIVVREITLHNVDRVKRFRYLKNGAMYSILVLGMVMVFHAFGAHIPEWFSPLATFAIVGYFFWKSLRK